MVGFADATMVAPGADASTFDAQVDAQWTVGGRPNGGYLLALLARAASTALDEADHPHPLAASGHFLAPAVVGPATVTIDRLRVGRTVSQVRARLAQDGGTCLEALLTMGRLAPAAEPYWSAEPPVPLPAPADCVHVSAQPRGLGFRIDMLDAVEMRLDPAVLGFVHGRPDRSGEVRAWVRFADDMPPDPVSLLYVADALLPATFTIHPSGWVPTLELTVYVRAVPAPGRLRVRQRTRLVAGGPRPDSERRPDSQRRPDSAPPVFGGLVDEVCDIWDSRDRLVAQATQLATVRFTAGAS